MEGLVTEQEQPTPEGEQPNGLEAPTSNDVGEQTKTKADSDAEDAELNAEADAEAAADAEPPAEV